MRGGASAEGGDDLGLAGVGDGVDGIAVEGRDLLVGDLEVGVGGHVAGGGVLEGGEDDDAVEVALGLEGDGLGEDLELLERGQFPGRARPWLLPWPCPWRRGRRRRPGGASGDPAADDVDLGGRQRSALRRHEVVVVLRQDETLDELALVGGDADERMAALRRP
jgi:hypothetical protein